MISWNVELEYSAADADSAKLEDLADHLAAEGAACGIGRRKISVTLVVEASTLSEALVAGITQMSASLARAKVSAKIVAARVLSPDELERELATTPIPQLVGVAEVANLLKVSRQRASELAQSAMFPPPVARLSAGPIWLRSSIVAFAKAWDRRPGRRPRQETASK
jgi:hypothetical protein